MNVNLFPHVANLAQTLSGNRHAVCGWLKNVNTYIHTYIQVIYHPDCDPAARLGPRSPTGTSQTYWETLDRLGPPHQLGPRRLTGIRSDQQAISQPNWGPAV